MAQIPLILEDGRETWIEIPDDVIAAAHKVYNWLKKHRAIQLHGLRLADYEN